MFLEFSFVPLLFVIAALISWFLISNKLSGFRGTLWATFLGIGISISGAESYKKAQEHRRIKRAFGYLKLITVPYIVNQSENLSATIDQYKDICSIDDARRLCVLVSNFDSISNEFDKSWLQLIYSPDFIDAFKKNNEGGEQFNNVAISVKEVLIFTKTLNAQAVICKNLIGDPSKLPQNQQDEYIKNARQVRDDLKVAITLLDKYTERLGKEISNFLQKNGTVYYEYDR